MNPNSKIAECAGLWLAEGDSKTKSEVTFTNNCLELILFFKDNIKKIYTGKSKPRLYIYSPTSRQLFFKINGFKKINFYIDERARKSYFMYRLADVKFVKYWRNLVEEIKEKPLFYADILRGFFAGEGNVHHALNCNPHRSIRISCKNKLDWLEKILEYYNIKYHYDFNHRNGYVISGLSLVKLNEIGIAMLYPEKQNKFKFMIDSLKQEHYSPGYLKNEVYAQLCKLHTSLQLARYFNRSQATIQQILSELKNENKVHNIRIKEGSLWGRNEVIERFLIHNKLTLLKDLNSVKTLTKLSENIHLGPKAIKRRLTLLAKENLISQNNGKWNLTKDGKNMICGIDESGRLI